MTLKLSLAAAVVALSAASPGFSQEVAPTPLLLSPSGAGVFTTSFQSMATGLFLDTFTFSPGAFNGNVSVSLMPISGSINFFAALLNDQPFSFLPERGQTKFEFQAMVTGDRPLELLVFGYAGGAGDPGEALTLVDGRGTYGGMITATSIAAIPEPETYALMLVGLAVVGGWGRFARRRQGASA